MTDPSAALDEDESVRTRGLDGYTHAQIKALPSQYGGNGQLGSDSNKAPRPKHRFSFNGPRKRPTVPEIAQTLPVARDDTSDSTQRHLPPQVGLHGEPFHLAPSHPEASTRHGNRGSLRGAVIIFLGGFVSVWLYGYLTKAYEIPYFSSLIESPEVQTGVQLASSHPVALGAISGIILLGALGVLYLRQRKKN